MIASKDKTIGEDGFLTDKEKEQLLQQLEDVVGEVADEQEAKVDELTSEVEELKQKVNNKERNRGSFFQEDDDAITDNEEILKVCSQRYLR